MASVFKRGDSKFWQITWFDHTGKRRTQSAKTTDHATAVRIGNKLEAEAALRREGIRDVRLESIKEESTKGISKQLDAFEASMKAKQRSGVHIDGTRNQIELLCNSCGFECLADIDPDRVNGFAASMSDQGKSARTIASYLQAIKSLTKWATKNGKLSADPLVTISKPSAESDRRVVRRFLTHEEWLWLDATTRSSRESFGMSGQERALLYAIAIQTGLRSNEIRSLTRGKLHLSQDPPFVMADGSKTKNGKPARQYIQPELANELKALVSKKLAGATVFNLPERWEVVGMFRTDLEAARQAWLETIQDTQKRMEADEGDFLKTINSENESMDFHSLRHTTASWLVQKGADVKSVQAIMRHSDIKLTLDRYGHLFPGSEAAAVDRMRSLFAPAIKQAATGTLGNVDRQHKRQHSGRFSVRQVAENCHDGDQQRGTGIIEITKEKTGFSKENPRENQNEGGGTRTHDQRIKSPDEPHEKQGSKEDRQHFRQHSIRKRLFSITKQGHPSVDNALDAFTRQVVSLVVQASPTQREAILEAIEAILAEKPACSSEAL